MFSCVCVATISILTLTVLLLCLMAAPSLEPSYVMRRETFERGEAVDEAHSTSGSARFRLRPRTNPYPDGTITVRANVV